MSREVPLLSKKGRYVISDNALLSWFRVVEPVLSKNPYPGMSEAVKEAMTRIEALAPTVYERVGRTHLIAWGLGKGRVFDEVGRFVHKGAEIDVVATSREARETHVAEVKWSDIDEARAQRIAEDPLSKAEELPRRLHVWRLVPHLIVRRYVGEEPPDGVIVLELGDVIKAV